MEENAGIDMMWVNPDLGRSGPNLPVKSGIERVLASLESHMALEKDAIDRYEAAASNVGNETIRFLTNLIIEEEEKHHQLLDIMIQTLRESLTWLPQPNAIHFHSDLGMAKEQLQRATERFLRQEREGIRKCRALKRESRNLYHGLFDIFFDLMIRDSLKHELILRYINKTVNQL